MDSKKVMVIMSPMLLAEGDALWTCPPGAIEDSVDAVAGVPVIGMDISMTGEVNAGVFKLLLSTADGADGKRAQQTSFRHRLRETSN